MFKKKAAYIKYSKRRMSQRKRRRIVMLILACVVIIAALLGTYFLVRFGNAPQVTYQEMGAASVPTITCVYKDKLINRMYGNRNEMDGRYMRDTLYLLQDTYDLDIHIDKTDLAIKSLSFRVMDLPKNNLIQDTDATDTLTEEDGYFSATLRIENMIEEEREYSMEITLHTILNGDFHYYCRIQKSSAPYLEDHIALIEKAHNSTFRYDTCEEVFSPFKSETDYLYDDTSSFGRITLYSTISWLSWEEMNVVETIPATINIMDYDNELGFFRMDYQVGRELKSTEPQYYTVSEYYRTRINESHTYLLDYERTVDQIFRPSGDLVSTDHVNLGILSDDNIPALCSPDGNRVAFVANKALWLMSAGSKELISVFDFVSDHSDVRDIYNQHDLKLVNVADNGDIRFIVYGYMNKGIHEGETGVGLYTFHLNELKVTEDAFIPSDVPYQLLRYSLGDLCFMNSAGQLYIMLNGTVYSIDPETNAAQVVVSGLSEETSKVSEDGVMLAWQDDSKINDATKIHVLNMETMQSYEIQADPGECIKVLGFLNGDLMYGEGDADAVYTDASDKEHLLMEHMYAVGKDGQIQNENSESGYYFINADQEYNRLIAQRVRKSEGTYIPAESFTIFATDLSDYPQASAYNAVEETRGLVNLLSFPEANSASTPLNIITTASVIFSSEEVSDVAQMVSDKWNYYVYAKGRLISPEENAAIAIKKAYDNTGCVVNPDSSYFYRRGMRAAMVELPQEIVDAAADAYRSDTAMNVTGIDLSQAMSFISRRIPLIWEREDNVYVISGYSLTDALQLYNLETGETTFMSYNSAEGIFSTTGKVFVYEY